MVNVSIDVTDLGGEARPGDKVVFWRPRMGGSATHAGRVISTAPVTVFLTNGKATVSDVEPGEMTVLLQCRGVESQGPVTVGVPDGNGTVTLRSLIESQFEYAPPIVSAVQEAAANASASERAAIEAQVRSEAAADRADAKVDDAINNGANLVRDEVKQDADRAVAARQAATQSESNAKASEGKAATSESNAKTSETNAKQSETNAGDYAAVATTAATEAVDAMEAASTSESNAKDSETAALNAVSRIDALEAMAGLAPESPVDGQTANLIAQDDTLTRQALTAAHVDLMTATSDTLTTDNDLITGTGWTLGAGWEGDLTAGFTHTPNGGGALEWALPPLEPTETYMLTVTVEGYAVNNNFPGDLSIDIAGVSLHPIYRGSGDTTQAYQRAFIPKNSDPLSITVKASTPARVTEVELVRVIGSIPATTTWRAPDGTPDADLRTHDTSVFLGKNAGQRHIGDHSVGIGTDALANDVTGFFNVAIGTSALRDSRRVSRNVAVGYQSLSENLGGDRNVAVGPFTGHRIRTGNENVLLGVDVMWKGDGSNNIGIGMYALADADGVTENIAIGKYAIANAQSGQSNYSIGTSSLAAEHPGELNIGVGRATLNKNTANYNVAVGHLAQYNMTSGANNVAVGHEALHGGPSATGERNVALGTRAGRATTTASRNTLVGYFAGSAITTGDSNTVLGNLAAEKLTTGENNIVLGHQAGRELSSGNGNILIGGTARSDNPNAYGFINLGDVLYGSRTTGNIGIGVEAPSAILHLKASTGGPGTAPLRFTAGPLVPTPVSGAMEFDGSKLYITISGVRREIALVTP